MRRAPPRPRRRPGRGCRTNRRGRRARARRAARAEIAAQPPRALNEPVTCRLSAFTSTRRPASAVEGGERRGAACGGCPARARRRRADGGDVGHALRRWRPARRGRPAPPARRGRGRGRGRGPRRRSGRAGARASSPRSRARSRSELAPRTTARGMPARASKSGHMSAAGWPAVASMFVADARVVVEQELGRRPGRTSAGRGSASFASETPGKARHAGLERRRRPRRRLRAFGGTPR